MISSPGGAFALAICEEVSLSNLSANTSQFGDELLQALSLQLRQKIFPADGRPLSPCSHLSDNSDNRFLICSEQIGREIVRVYGCEVPGGERLLGKVFQPSENRHVTFPVVRLRCLKVVVAATSGKGNCEDKWRYA
jgi:hypothetical protein